MCYSGLTSHTYEILCDSTSSTMKRSTTGNGSDNDEFSVCELYVMFEKLTRNCPVEPLWTIEGAPMGLAGELEVEVERVILHPSRHGFSGCRK